MIRFSRALWACAALGFLLPTSTQAQTSNFQSAPLYSARDISRRTLPNGVTDLVKSAPDFDLVCVQVWVRGGSRAERAGESGMAHLVERAAARGSKGFPAGEEADDSGLNGAIRSVGGESGSLTSRDATFFSSTTSSKDWGRALNTLADAVLRPDLSNASVEATKELVAEDLARRAFDPVTSALDLAYATAYKRHPYTRPAIGTEGNLGNLSGPKARDFHARQYVGGNIFVVIVGRVSPAQAHAAIARAFAPASSAKPAVVTIPTDPQNGPLEVTRRTPIGRDCLTLAWRSAGVKQARDVVTLDTLLALWREGLDANLRRALLRDGEEGALKPLVASFDVDYLTQRDPGLFAVSLTGVRDREAARRVVLDEIARVARDGLTPEELARAKTQLRDQYIEQSENAAGQAGSFGFYQMIDDANFASNYLSLCAQVTNADVQRVAKTYLSPNRLVEAEIVPLPRPRVPDEGDIDNDDTITAQLSTKPIERVARLSTKEEVAR